MSTVTLPSACMIKRGVQRRTSIPFLSRSSSQFSINSSSKAFGLKASSPFNVSATASHKVNVIGLEGEQTEFGTPEDRYIFDSIETAGVELLSSCRDGAHSTCVGKMGPGYVDQSDGSFLDDEKMGKEHVLIFVSYPTYEGLALSLFLL
ncbi:hypothetical protein ACHQM5_002934 [Ranunculus cassubicifolius]